MILAPLLALRCALHADPPAPSRTDGPGSPPPQRRAAQPPPAERAELVYFVLVDRFANGDPGNDTASPGPAVDRDDPQGWHGGDIRGVIEHLDHVAALGATQLWLSPVFRTRTEPLGGWGAYHGYWQWDPTEVEPRFGSRAELIELSEALRERDMGLLIDLVTNHVGYGAPIIERHPDWFHHTPSIQDWEDPVQLEQWQVHGLPDIDQDNPDAAAWLRQAARSWRDTLHPTGFRVDAVRHVPNSFLAALGAALAGDGTTWWVGEDFEGDPAALADSQRTGGFTHVFDFPLYYAMTDVFCDDAAPSRIASVLYLDRLYERPDGLVTFLDNHDLPRIRSRCHDDLGAERRALLFMFSTRGVPALTYGTEAGLTGSTEPDNRADMRFDVDLLGDLLRRSMEVRSQHPALRVGAQRVLSLGSHHLVLARVSGDEAAIVAVNNGDEPLSVDLPEALGDAPVHRRLTVAGEAPLVIDAPGRRAAPLHLPARSVRTWLLDGVPSSWPAEGAPVAVEIVAEDLGGATLIPGGTLRLVGAAPELGGWDPARGLVLTARGSSWTGTLTLPVGAVLEGKLVVVGPDGSVQWSDSPNQAYLVDADGPRWTVSW